MEKSEIKSKFFIYFEKYMFCIGVIGQLLFYSQAVKIFSTKSAGDISLFGFLLGFITVSSWMIYGILIKNRVLVLSNIIAAIGALLVVIGALIYG